ncbi:MAG: hypothetical protein JW772_01570 [Candidatus Diapherotrites archaeon]|nr:hypothetical protein [Candidatus Diapherotrites archaeon]
MSENKVIEIEKEIFSAFAGVASTIGYSDVHGKIIAALTVENAPVSLQELGKKTGYSPAMLSLSIDFLEVLGVVKKIKKTRDRKLYVDFQGNLLDCLRKAVLFKAEKSINDSIKEFELKKKELKQIKDGVEKKKVLRTLNILQKEVNRLQRYLKILAKLRIP